MKKLIIIFLISLFPSILFSQEIADTTSFSQIYEVIFQNNSGRDIWVAVKYFPVGKNNPLTTKWRYMINGEEKSICFTDADVFYYSAKTASGRGTWTGGYSAKVENRNVGMRRINISKNNSIPDSIFVFSIEWGGEN